MCGIVGYIGDTTCAPILLQNLKHLEYRGYDSAGIALLHNHQLKIVKEVGNIATLEKKYYSNTFPATIGIGHTRWATHGKPSLINAHPQISPNGHWAIVHNGIIENSNHLKTQLSTPFVSQTDTEVICHLLQQNEHLPTLDNFISTCQQLTGSYAICMMYDQEECLYLAKQKSPLYIACNGHSCLVASDPIVFGHEYPQYYSLEDGQWAKATKGKVVFYNNQQEKIEKHLIDTPTKCLSTLNEYHHYMEKEIAEIPKTLQDTYAAFSKTTSIRWSKYRYIHLIGCGTSYHAGCMGELYFRKYGRIHAKTSIASEFRYNYPVLDKHTLYILISQSGETADTLACGELLKENGCDTLAITNVAYSKISQLCTYLFTTQCGPEISVASTKAYNNQILVLYLLAKSMKRQSTLSLSSITQTIDHPNDNVIQLVNTANKVIFVGKGEDYITAKEGSLKLKEITYINSIALPCGELKHGSIALIDNNTIVVVISTKKDMIDKTNNCIHEIQARGGQVVLVTSLDPIHFCHVEAHIVLSIKEEELSSLVSIIPLQLLAYKIATIRHLNPDQPRNLAKSVTVE